MPLRVDAPGDYTVAYHVTFADGTAVTGAHRFSVGTGVAPAPLDDAARRASTDVVVDAHGHGIDGFSAFPAVRRRRGRGRGTRPAVAASAPAARADGPAASTNSRN
ncbi:copper resistance protein CopC [Micromonospora sp. ATCC 39149]|uniref:copper resistance protein CopC n=1 Tax=Micromonospora sp. (strain ATCC 39149 / NRRL 15099 / SCC 1413) TaxID=219305 RepID=UPI0009FE62A2